MDELERILRPDTTELRASLDPDGSLDEVVARGRRRTLARRVATGVAAVAVVVAGFAVIAGADTDRTELDVISPDPTESEANEDRDGGTTTTDPDDDGESGESSTTVGTTPIEPGSSWSTTTRATTEQPPPEERVELDISVATDARTYRTGEEITVVVQACNRSDRPAEEYFADSDAMFRVRMVTADDRTVALGTHPRQGPATQTWNPGECRGYTTSWDQTEGELESEGGQAAWPGEYTAQVDWFSTAPPPEGMDPGLYDPAMPDREPAVSPVFTIEDDGTGSTDLSGGT